ncbi:MAG: hypothetical protein ABIP03_03965 [Aquihabitans sp.]
MSCPLLARVGATILLATSVLTGCALFGQEDPTVTGSPAPAVGRATEPTTVVLNRGAAPRRALRMNLKAGDVTTVALTIDLEIVQRDADQADQAEAGDSVDQIIDPPAIREVVRFRVDRVAGDVADLSFAFTGATVDRTGTNLTDPEFVELTASVQKIIGLGGQGQITNRGVVQNFRYDPPEDIDPNVATALRNAEDQMGALAFPLPVEAVGVGAQWRSTTQSKVSGISVRQTTTYNLTAVAGDTLTYTATTRQEAAEQPVEEPSGATTAKVVSSEVRGSGSGTTNLDSLRAEGKSTLQVSQVIDQGATKSLPARRVVQELELTVTIGPVG